MRNAAAKGRCQSIRLNKCRRATQRLKFRGGGMELNNQANIGWFMKCKNKR